MKELPEAVRTRLQPIERTLETLETPAVLIDADVADANLRRWQERCDRAGLANRPHIKTHRTAAWALRQVELGAKGVTVQTVGEAEVIADAGERMHRALCGVELDREVTDLEQVVRLSHRVASGSRAASAAAGRSRAAPSPRAG